MNKEQSRKKRVECPAFERTERAELSTFDGFYYRNGLPAAEKEHSQGWFDMSERELESVEHEQDLMLVDLINAAMFEAAKNAMLCDSTEKYFEWILSKAFREEVTKPMLAKRLYDLMPKAEQSGFFEYAIESGFLPAQLYYLISGLK